MTCPTCHGPTEWRGSLARGRMACPKCDPDDDTKTMVFGKGHVSLVLARYYSEVNSWHRAWCRSRKMVNTRPGQVTDPQFCDCGFQQVTPYSETEIEQREIANYGRPTP